MSVLILILAIVAVVLAVLAFFGGEPQPRTGRLLCGSVLCLAAIEILQHL